MNISEEDEITMCELFDQYIRKGVSQGIQILITSCKELGITFDATADKVKTKYNLADINVQKNMALYW